MKGFIHLENVSYETTNTYNNTSMTLLKNINFFVNKGEFISVMGPNGCGKSTLARLLNATLLPTSGEIHIDGLNTKNHSIEIKKKIGMVFQNPDNQIISSTVEEEIAFGLENLCTPTKEMDTKIKNALHKVGLDGFEKKSINSLSGGQKQKLIIAGILAMEPEAIIFDEPTSMLDPDSKKNIMNIILKLKNIHKMTIILITHYIKEALHSDKVVLLNKSKIVSIMPPKDLFSDVKLIARNGILPLASTDILYSLKANGYENLDIKKFHTTECAEEIIKILEKTK
ncbi:MAG: ATP-binding cassette domain-containing protein [Acutalibacteraceae bacterium]